MLFEVEYTIKLKAEFIFEVLEGDSDLVTRLHIARMREVGEELGDAAATYARGRYESSRYLQADSIEVGYPVEFTATKART